MNAALSFFSGPVKCPACGHSGELPRITPEMMYLRASSEGLALPEKGVPMDGGTLAVHFAGVIYVMRPDELERVQQLRRNWQPLELDAAA